jgi:leucyl aminopeptidase
MNNERFILGTHKNNLTVKINIFGLSNIILTKEINKIKDTMNIYPKITKINIIFDKKIQKENVNKILTKLNNVLYSYYPNNKTIKLYQVEQESKVLMEEISEYKHIVMKPGKNPDNYLEWVKLNTPSNYNIYVTNVLETELFPLTRAVGCGSRFNPYFVHIQPKNEIPTNKNVYLIGKAITFDSGGMNLKDDSMVEMKTDMAGSALVLTVLKIMSKCNFDSKLNIHLIIPIAENMIGPKATKPSEVIRTMSNKLVEITNTDAEGRLCITDGIDYVNMNLSKNKNTNDCLIIDVATLTGNAVSISNGVSSMVMSNKSGTQYKDNLINMGEQLGEYFDSLKLREEYDDFLKSNVGDIKNVNLKERGGCILGGQFLHYFTNPQIPWLHLDIAPSAFIDDNPKSFGINLLVNFLKNI